jgi:hypothetical protein
MIPRNFILSVYRESAEAEALDAGEDVVSGLGPAERFRAAAWRERVMASDGQWALIYTVVVGLLMWAYVVP